jgi:hypothetical protein
VSIQLNPRLGKWHGVLFHELRKGDRLLFLLLMEKEIFTKGEFLEIARVVDKNNEEKKKEEFVNDSLCRFR